MANSRVTRTTDGDAEVLRWGDTGKAYTFRPGDDEGMRDAYMAAVAEGVARGDQVLDEVERSIARELQKNIGISFEPPQSIAEKIGLSIAWQTATYDPRVRKDAADTTLVGWFPDSDTCAAILKACGVAVGGNGLTASSVESNTGFDLHLSLLYLGDPDVDGTQLDLQLIAAVTKLFTRWREPLQGCISGIGRFVGPEDTDCLVALVDIPGLNNMRHCLKDELSCYGAIPWNSPAFEQNHGYVPHLTLAYIPKTQKNPDPLEDTIPICVNSISVACGSQQICFPLGTMSDSVAAEGSMDPYYAARETYQLSKAGKKVSAASRKLLKDAIAALQKLYDADGGALGTGAGSGSNDSLGDQAASTEKRREFLATIAGVSPEAFDVEYIVTKSVPGQRYTLGPLYAPDRKDAHGEYTGADTLQKACWDFVQEKFDSGNNRLNLQHGDLGEIEIANMVEIMAWPYEHDITIKAVGGQERTITMPAGTVYLGAIWDEDAFPLVEKGKINGWSLGGKAVRVTGSGDLPHMGDKIAGKIQKAMHKFAGGGKKCAICSKGYQSGDHYGNEDDDS